jgi:hypothetical protein
VLTVTGLRLHCTQITQIALNGAERKTLTKCD